MSASGEEAQNILYTFIFWFCRNPGLALPLIALQYHEVKVILNHQWQSAGPFTTAAFTNKLFCDYIYLDTDESRRFSQVSHMNILLNKFKDNHYRIQMVPMILTLITQLKKLIWTRSSSSSASMDPRRWPVQVLSTKIKWA